MTTVKKNPVCVKVSSKPKKTAKAMAAPAPAPKKDRSLALLAWLPDIKAGILRITEKKSAEKTTTDIYFIRHIPSDFGYAMEFAKRVEHADGTTSEQEPYAACVDGQRMECDCKGNLQWGHCRHGESIIALLASGKIS